MSRIDPTAAHPPHRHSPEPGTAGVEQRAEPRRAGASKVASPSATTPGPHRAAVDGLVERQTRYARFKATRAALQHDPGLADQLVTLRLQGRSSVDHQIVRAALARSGTTGMQKLALCESALRQIATLDSTRRADVLALVTTGSSVHAAIVHVRDAVAGIQAEAARKSRHSMAHELDSAIRSLRQEAADWRQTAGEVNALYRKVPVLSRWAEGATGVLGATATVGELELGAIETAVTLGGKHVGEALDKANRAGSYVFGELNDKIGEARSLYMGFSKQHIAYVEQNQRMQRAIQSADFKTQTEARARMDELSAGMKRTVARFRPVAEKAVRMDRQFDEDTRHAVESVLLSAASTGAEMADGKAAIDGIRDAVKLGFTSSIEQAAFTQVLDRAESLYTGSPGAD